MSEAGYERCLGVAWQPANDGQPYHVTMGDAGGGTRMGLLFSNFSAWRQQHGLGVPSVADFQNAPLSELSDIIHAWIWCPVHGDQMPVGVDLILFEIGFGSGPGWAARLLKRAMALPEDFRMDPDTIRRVQGVNDVRGLICNLTCAHKEFVDALPSASLFQRGWDRRIQGDETTALSWQAPMQVAM
jgi:lysozyme family protein